MEKEDAFGLEMSHQGTNECRISLHSCIFKISPQSQPSLPLYPTQVAIFFPYHVGIYPIFQSLANSEIKTKRFEEALINVFKSLLHERRVPDTFAFI